MQADAAPAAARPVPGPPREDSGPRNLLLFSYSAYTVGPGGEINSYFAFDIIGRSRTQHTLTNTTEAQQNAAKKLLKEISDQ